MKLPIEAIASELRSALRSSSNFVLQAEPGAGKTTRVPVMLMELGVAEHGEIWVSQPRRIAARMAAARVAAGLGEPVGRTCGYQVRFETKASRDTKIRFMTEGLLSRRLRDAPELPGVSAVVLDEFHERHVDADVSLTLLRRLQRSARPDLRIGVMSATLNPDPVASYLGCPPLRCPGRTHPVEIEHIARSSDRPLTAQISNALRDLGQAGIAGSVLVFLPGSREIRDCLEACSGQARSLGLDPVALYGELPAAEQDAAVSVGDRSKLIVSTNVAETSITVEGVVAVIDSGLARRPSFDPWSGVPKLTLAKISQASATQRAGRAGRTRPGRCIRLYTRPDFDRRPEFDVPELARSDLAQPMLDLRAAGIRDPRTLAWFERPPSAAIDSAESLLRLLSAIDDDGEPSKTGREMLRLPAHPRLARLLVEAKRRGVARTGAAIAALLSQRPIRRRSSSSRHASAATGITADVVVDVEHLREFERDKSAARRLELDAGACHSALRVQRQLLRALGPKLGENSSVEPDEAIGYALLAGFPDRVGALRDGGRRVVFSAGGSAELPEESAAAGSDLVVVLDVEQRRSSARSRTIARSAAAIETDWLLDLLTDQIQERAVVRFDENRERIEASEELAFGALVLERRVLEDLPAEARTVLQAAARARGPEAFVDDPERLRLLHARTVFAHGHNPDIVPLDREQAMLAVDDACDGARSFADLRKCSLLERVSARLAPAARASLERLAPGHVTLAGGRRLLVHYELDRPPWVESRLQDFFGLSDGPRVAEGREALVLHLLAPNRRAVQVTTDLSGFWERHYPDLRRALMRRYPRHDWPDDPVSAAPPRPGRRRR